ncbi:hypothetical protein HN512_04350 [Candidatus Peregrinibacteria bacterium]|jgi:hypothetical protein|nr:hypothetical protein [Candidatus Peregrinibacteria bacterium]MBT4586270.1 hypothetical protein [Candidatus Peregrinibacteria bacterium]MBT6730655.1 hypothetical protein [Candidatus Peregrinibacteria bacterium]MBT7009167.1 hypothetical protein [Candidatus Peregrinibacteria bacterium]MBT7928287.1 hypothetical protein [Candidatus Peregrinibacteria bacterium]
MATMQKAKKESALVISLRAMFESNNSNERQGALSRTAGLLNRYSSHAENTRILVGLVWCYEEDFTQEEIEKHFQKHLTFYAKRAIENVKKS